MLLGVVRAVQGSVLMELLLLLLLEVSEDQQCGCCLVELG
jgi:hypothetical protein